MITYVMDLSSTPDVLQDSKLIRDKANGVVVSVRYHILLSIDRSRLMKRRLPLVLNANFGGPFCDHPLQILHLSPTPFDSF